MHDPYDATKEKCYICIALGLVHVASRVFGWDRVGFLAAWFFVSHAIAIVFTQSDKP